MAPRHAVSANDQRVQGELPVPEGTGLPADMTPERLRGREALAGLQGAGGPRIDSPQQDAHRRQALDLILAPEARRAFDLSSEPDRVRNRYGRFEMGQVFLLARRLIEAGVRFVTANAVSNPPNTTLSAFQI